MGFNPGRRTAVVDPPPELGNLLAPVLACAAAVPDWHLFFLRDRAAVARAAAEHLPAYRRGQHLWACYPKRASGVATDLTRDAGWEPFAAFDLLGVAQIALDATWSALRFRYRDEIPRLTRKT